MYLFLLAFIFIYGSMHLYAFLRARTAFAFGIGSSIILASFLAIMVMAPIALRLLDRHGLHQIARFFAYVGYAWMGLLFYFVWIGLCLDIISLFIRFLAFMSGSHSGGLVWGARKTFALIVASTLVLGLWSMFSAWHIRLDRLTLKTVKLPAQVDRLVIVQISDLHLGLMVGKSRLAGIIELVKQSEPDIVVCTGDLVDAQTDSLDHLAEMLAALRPPRGKYAVLGNHEVYSGVERSERFLQAAGFTLLRNQRQRLGDILTIVGMDDPVAGRRQKTDGSAEQKEVALLPESNSSIFTLLLKHRPVVEPESLGRFDLQMSGHTHNGQMFPFSLVTGYFYPRQNGLYPLEKRSLLYVSRGAGTWGPPMRFLASPQVTRIELKRMMR